MNAKSWGKEFCGFLRRRLGELTSLFHDYIDYNTRAQES